MPYSHPEDPLLFLPVNVVNFHIFLFSFLFISFLCHNLKFSLFFLKPLHLSDSSTLDYFLFIILTATLVKYMFHYWEFSFRLWFSEATSVLPVISRFMMKVLHFKALPFPVFPQFNFLFLSLHSFYFQFMFWGNVSFSIFQFVFLVSTLFLPYLSISSGSFHRIFLLLVLLSC